MDDKEIKALSTIVSGFNELEDESTLRVFEYLIRRFGEPIKKAREAELRATQNIIHRFEKDIQREAEKSVKENKS